MSLFEEEEGLVPVEAQEGIIQKSSLRALSWQVPELVYRQHPALSYSGLSTYQNEGIAVLTEHSFKSNAGMRFGSIEDTMLLEPEVFADRFVVIGPSRPKDDLLEVLEKCKEYLINNNNIHPDLSTFDRTILENIVEECGYGASNWKLTTKVDKCINEGKDYFPYMFAKGELISKEDYSNALKCKEVLLTHPFTADYFNDANLGKYQEAFNQLKFVGTITKDGIDYTYRIMVDRIIVDHEHKTIRQIDLKTTGKNEEDFPQSFVDFNYYIQAELYRDVLLSVIKKDPYYSEYTLLPFTFIPINRYNLSPIVYEYVPNIALERILAYKKKKDYITLTKEIMDFTTNPELQKYIKSKYSYDTIVNKGKKVITL